MAKIKKIKDNNGTTIYPLTSVDAVFDKSGKTLTGGGALSFIAGPNDDLRDNSTINSIIAQYHTTSISSKGRDSLCVLCLDNKYIRTWQFYHESQTSPGEKGDQYKTRLSGSGVLKFILKEAPSEDRIEIIFYPFEFGGKKYFKKTSYGVSINETTKNFIDTMGDWDAYWVLYDNK